MDETDAFWPEKFGYQVVRLLKMAESGQFYSYNIGLCLNFITVDSLL